MDIVLLGSGNVATSLAKALKNAGERLLQVYSPNIEHAVFLAKQVGAEGISNLSEVVRDTDLYIISVKDDAIEQVAQSLTEVSGLVVHTSGTTDIKSLAGHLKRVGVFYPLQTFSKSRLVSLDDVPLCLESSSDDDLGILITLAERLSSRVYQLNGEKRKVLHLSAVFACNFPNHLYALAAEVLQQSGLDFDIMRPLIRETADKVMVNMPLDMQTGPSVRKDESTVNKHLSMLNNLPHLQEIYQTLSNSIKLIHK
ncbi:Rossmann-like and DUF2520 domain-containing protein [Pedobacter frigidisoli]|uniref:Rossmann-like and DUF2520 domain-containing protein n=1 Tax=Pedobacter frigidisoli TaxID=2530455 RepID=UPI00292EAD6C|nr:Rossmann-like and DUF2520 domain-containing protein [Pedobacter frigidisoli]